MGKINLSNEAQNVLQKWRKRLDAGDLMTDSQIVLYLDSKAEKNHRTQHTPLHG